VVHATVTTMLLLKPLLCLVAFVAKVPFVWSLDGKCYKPFLEACDCECACGCRLLRGITAHVSV
jgi:hypothetical protein